MTIAATASPTVRSPAVPLILVVVAGCVIAAITNGIRTSFGLFTLPATADLGLSREAWGMAMAIQNLVWGLAQPFAGAIADKQGTARVIIAGLAFYAAGLLLMVISPTALLLNLTAGVLCGVGIAASSFSIVMIAFGRNVPQEKRPLIFGVATAASSFGQFAFAPIGQGFISAYGPTTALLLLSGFVALVPILAASLSGKGFSADTEPAQSVRQALTQAMRHPSYLLLMSGFFVCGFHIAFISTHLPPYLSDLGLSTSLAAWSLSLIGLFNVIGAYSSGLLGGVYPRRLLLSGIYLGRGVAFTLFVLIPASPVTVIVFSATLGLLWLSTVPLTSGLVALMFGTRHVGMLFGLVFFSHQVGAFAGALLGGIVYEATGNYDLMWVLCIVLSVAAGLVHLPIRERRAAELVVSPA